MYAWMIELFLTIAAIGAGLMAGVYFAFSDFIMRSLNRLDAANAVDAMNTINEVILRSWFMPLFFGTSLLYLLLAVLALFDWSDPNTPLLLTADLTYFCGMFLCTVFFNVPLNNRLKRAATINFNSGPTTINTGPDGIILERQIHWLPAF